MTFLRRACLAALFAFTLSTFTPPALAFDLDSPRPINLDGKGVALHGYDPVAYFTRAQATRGDPRLSADYAGARYQFANLEDLDLFQKSPAKYIPAYGGFCAYAAALGYKADIDPDSWKIVNGKLYVNFSRLIFWAWSKDIPRYTRDADVNWTKISNRAPGSF